MTPELKIKEDLYNKTSTPGTFFRSTFLPKSELKNAQAKEYTKEIAEHQVNWNEVKDEMIDFVNEGNPNIGWKLHLNISPENVVFVDKYLREKGICFKFLHGSELEDGFIFTIYVGSFQKTQEISKILTKDLQNFLAQPHKTNHLEFSAGVVGRFRGAEYKNKDFLFSSYSPSGFSWLEYDKRNYSLKKTTKIANEQALAKQKKESEIRAIKELQFQYGDYFFPEEN
ncbi:hypothetical protein HN954_00595 [bacterium]|nr:hypothetical protein [bacterium]MBT6832368.1 hypothetical protein [bacterium]MBT6995913.1 hypothetical protein [bacterium]MBT7772774.1 hypothetical protein [bacterium]